MQSPWQDVAATSDWVAELCDLHRPDVVHMNTFTPLARGVPVLLTVHSCVETWWRAVHASPAPPEWERYRELVRRALGRADLITVPTRALLSELHRAYGPLTRARVIANGLSIAAGGSDEPERLVVTVGRLWDEAKNLALLAAAADAIDGRVIALGPGGGAEGIECMGEVDPETVHGWLSRAAVFAEPARYEPFGLAALEAALCGCALVLGDIPSLREVWREAATFVSPDDAEALARAVNRLLEDRALRRASAAAARRRAAAYTPAAMVDGYIDAYRELVGARV
jgi:glycosyltransferase involved in cell wall biosynthesis